MKCTICGSNLRDVGEEKLDQSGETYLPARKYQCTNNVCATETAIFKTGEPYRKYPQKEKAPTEEPFEKSAE